MSDAAATSAEALARHFLFLASKEREASPLTQMHLHKLLYYAQGWSLALDGKVLFQSHVEAWSNGPVVRDVYPVFRSFGRNAIPESESREGLELAPQGRAIALAVWRAYRRYSASALWRRTHREQPWLTARGSTPEGERSRATITIESMRDFFVSELDRRSQLIGVSASSLLEARAQCRSGQAVSWDQLRQELLGHRGPASRARDARD